MSFKEFTKELNGKRVEGELVKTFILSLVVAFITFALIYFLFLKNNGSFNNAYIFYIFFSIISFAFIVPTIRQVRAYKEFACMSGMMIGMTSGMISGFLIGFYLGATNGMFIGSFAGIIVGIIIGTTLGLCCGIMGYLEGIMAGFMGGLMGAMTSVMMINDNLKIATILISIVSYSILLGLNYMIYFEMKENVSQKKEDNFLTVILTFILVVVAILIMVFGPRGPIHV